MAILLTGGTGKTSVRLARFLQDAKIPFILASRKAEAGAPSGMQAVKFDWLDSSTYDNPFQHKFHGGEGISAVYLIAPEVSDPVPIMNSFIDHAVKKHGVKRFVLLTGSSVDKGGYYHGKVWSHLVDIGVEYCVLRATWFNGALCPHSRLTAICPTDEKALETFLERQHLASIKDEGKIYTACQDGKIPFVSATDIAAVAFHALIDEKPHNCDYRVLGPELLTYDKVTIFLSQNLTFTRMLTSSTQVAAKLSKGLERHIEHARVSEEESEQRYLKMGFPEHYAKLATSIEVRCAGGMEDRMSDAVETVTGRPPQKFDAWVQENMMIWQ